MSPIESGFSSETGDVKKVAFSEFKRLDLRTARIVDVRPHPDADRLWILTLDIGTDKTKEIVAGVKTVYEREALLDRTIIVVNNLEPAVIRGVRSEGMLLAAKSTDALTLLTTDASVPPGTPIG